MEIRFCDRCSESIPESDFEAGRAVSVKGQSLHVACALGRSLALTGPRGWLAFLLALYAAGVATWLLVGRLGETEEPDRVSPAVEARVVAASTQARDEALRGTAPQIEQAMGAVDRRAAEALAAHAEEANAALLTLGRRIGETDEKAAAGLEAMKTRLERLELEIARLNDWIRTVAERAERAATPAPPPPPPVEPAPPEEGVPPEPVPETMGDPEREREVQRWIERLADPNENIRFSATLELGRLKDLKAVEPLVQVLERDRDFYVRLGAATALGDLRAADAVPVLIGALDDKDGLVRTAASDALKAITKEQRAPEDTFAFDAEMSTTERRRVQRRWRDWWKENEEGLRAKLGQPAASR